MRRYRIGSADRLLDHIVAGYERKAIHAIAQIWTQGFGIRRGAS